MAEGNILSWLKYDNYRAIFEAVIDTTKSAKDIAKLTNLRINDVAENLRILQNCGAVSYSTSGWRATSEGIAVYTKYYT